ncbi:G-protein coupled receptor Mth2-like [Chelonus insularis]|uniref:G-protein coupled receptor Mth2-like n=1 Tax=Chelonus insularis TaxID=460826 RepID=UPI00158DF1ED|nr:G-protein coupled receptor Mth2-like [Chelonus insularis]
MAKFSNSNYKLLPNIFQLIPKSLLAIVFIITVQDLIVSTSTNQPIIISLSINDSVIPSQYQNLSRVGKCCPLGQVLLRNTSGSAKCGSLDSPDLPSFVPFFNDFNRSGIATPGHQKDKFIAVIGDPCENKKYMLEPDVSSDDDHYLLINGSVFSPYQEQSMLNLGTDYCMEVMPELGLRTLVCFKGEDQVIIADFRLTFYACGLLISVPFLILTIVAYYITPKLLDVHGKALCHYCGCLTVAFTTLAIVQLTSSYLSDQFCISMAFIIQFSFIACFFWLNVMCIETYLLLRRYIKTGNATSAKPDKLFFYYSLWAWVPPGILIFISIIINLSPTIPVAFVKPNFGSESCWFESDLDAMPYFYVPVGILVVANIILFVLTAILITHHQRELDLQRLREDRDVNRVGRRTFNWLRKLFLVCLGLFFLMGINWAMEVISWCAGGDPLTWSAFDLVNALQGIIVFSIFVLRKPIRQLVWYQVQRMFKIEAEEPEIGSMDRCLLRVLNVEGFTSQRIP